MNIIITSKTTLHLRQKPEKKPATRQFLIRGAELKNITSATKTHLPKTKTDNERDKFRENVYKRELSALKTARLSEERTESTELSHYEQALSEYRAVSHRSSVMNFNAILCAKLHPLLASPSKFRENANLLIKECPCCVDVVVFILSRS